MKDEFVIAPGAVFKVTWRLSRDESREFQGTYKWISAIGPETAMVFDVDGTLRFVAASAIACMDQVEAAPEEPEKKRSDSGSVFYG